MNEISTKLKDIRSLQKMEGEPKETTRKLQKLKKFCMIFKHLSRNMAGWAISHSCIRFIKNGENQVQKQTASNQNYSVMGQVNSVMGGQVYTISKGYRGQSIFDGMHQKIRSDLSGQYNCVVVAMAV